MERSLVRTLMDHGDSHLKSSAVTNDMLKIWLFSELLFCGNSKVIMHNTVQWHIMCMVALLKEALATIKLKPRSVEMFPFSFATLQLSTIISINKPVNRIFLSAQKCIKGAAPSSSVPT